jgi:hypothetical protein
MAVAAVQPSKTIARIPSMKLSDTVNVWRNAVRILSDETKSTLHAQARLALEAVRQEWVRRRRDGPVPGEMFDWPSTDANPGSTRILTDDWQKDGVLKYMGYRVGSTDGVAQHVRLRILDEVFSGPIPPAFPDEYLDEWSSPGSAARLQKMAETIAALTRNAKRRRDSKLMYAIRDWERDLEYLYYQYYVGHFRFIWPVTLV